MNNVKNENITKDIKKLIYLINLAKGYRTINNFAADCKTNANYIVDIINNRINALPTKEFLKLISDNSEGRVSFKDLLIACGYSLYEDNNLESIKNIYARRGWIAYADFGDNVLDSEYGGQRLSLIIQNDKGNTFSSTTIVIPLTSRKTKSKLPTHVEIERKFGLSQDSIVSCEQIRCISKRRLLFNGTVQKVTECPDWLMRKVEVALLKAEGVIDLYTNEEDVIEMLENLNQPKQNTYYNSSHNVVPQYAMA